MPTTPSLAPLRPGTLVALPDGTIAAASPDIHVGARWDGVSYRTTQRNPATGGQRIDAGWTREQLTPVPEAA